MKTMLAAAALLAVAAPAIAETVAKVELVPAKAEVVSATVTTSATEVKTEVKADGHKVEHKTEKTTKSVK